MRKYVQYPCADFVVGDSAKTKHLNKTGFARPENLREHCGLGYIDSLVL
jgi:hypothetical protein